MRCFNGRSAAYHVCDDMQGRGMTLTTSSFNGRSAAYHVCDVSIRKVQWGDGQYSVSMAAPRPTTSATRLDRRGRSEPRAACFNGRSAAYHVCDETFGGLARCEGCT